MARALTNRILMLFFATMCLFVLCSCGGGGSSEAEPVSPSVSVTNSESVHSFSSMGSGSETPEQSSGEPSATDKEGRDEPEHSESSSFGEGSSSDGASLSESSAPAASEPAAGARDNTPVIYSPSAPGTVVYSNSLASIDCSNAASGYIMAKYTGSNGKVKMQLTKSGGSTYTYNLGAGYGYQAFPLSDGAGSYTVAVYENVSGNQYSQAFAASFTADVANGTVAYLYSNQYVSFNADSACVAKGMELAAGASTDLDVVTSVYNWTIGNVSYDFNKASSVTSGYVPNSDSTLSTCTGICFDYASLMCAMLRSQGIPTRLVIGWSGSIYHAWISVYITDVGWLNDYIYFDGTGWKRMDPTFASGGENSRSINDYINNGANYNALEFH